MIRLLLLVNLILYFLSCAEKHNSITSEATADSVVADIYKHVQPSINQINYAAAIEYLDSIYPQIKDFNHDGIMSSWLRLKGTTFMFNEQYDSADSYLNRSHLVAQNISTSNKYLIEAKTKVMDCFARQQKYDSALIYGLNAYQLGQKMDTNSIAGICAVLSAVYERLGDTANRKKYLFEGYQESNDPNTKVVLTNNIAKYYFDIGRVDSAIAFHEKVNFDPFTKDNYYYKSVSLANIGTILTETGDFEKGLDYFKQTAELNKMYDMVSEWVYLNIAHNYFLQEKYNQSTKYVDTTISIAKPRNNYIALSNAFGQLADNLRALNKTEEAYQALDSSYSYYSKNDSISFVEKANELETRYAARAKDEKISNLAFQNRASNQIRNQQRILIISMIVAVALMIAFVTLLWKRRQMKMEFQEFQLKQRLLRTQMDSHFLFNSLNTLKDSIRNEQPDKSINYLTKFSRLIRLGLQNAQKNFVTLKDEIAAIEDYLSLQVANFNHQFSYQIEIYDGYENDKIFIPPMLIQPFIENSVLHGISKLSNAGYIQIKIEKKKKSIYCIIEDNGKGLVTSESLEKKQSLATTITQDRLDILKRQTGMPAKLDIVDKQNTNEGHGVRVTLLIPFRKI